MSESTQPRRGIMRNTLSKYMPLLFQIYYASPYFSLGKKGVQKFAKENNISYQSFGFLAEEGAIEIVKSKDGENIIKWKNMDIAPTEELVKKILKKVSDYAYESKEKNKNKPPATETQTEPVSNPLPPPQPQTLELDQQTKDLLFVMSTKIDRIYTSLFGD